MRRPSVRQRVWVPLQTSGGVVPAEVVSFHGVADGLEPVAVVFLPLVDPPLVRVHSECLTGDVLGSARCDCGAQLRESLDLLATAGGVLLYLRQEGRGIGLYAKLDAYAVQDRLGLDTFAANRRIGRLDDERDYAIAAQLLAALGIGRVRLLTNNPQKVTGLADHGIEVAEVVRTGVHRSEFNQEYLLAKRQLAGHALG